MKLPTIYSAKTGHHSIFLKCLHYTLFGASPKVCKFLYENGVSPQTQYLPDFKFLTRVMAVLISVLNYKPKLTIEQFFKYGFAEQKMLLCCDVVELVRRKHRQLKLQRSLSAKRQRLTRSAESSRYTNISHAMGKEANFKFERVPP